jgi:methylated-DNA-protein-cysteine methyltransferase-like protein
MAERTMTEPTLQQKIWQVVAMIPYGKVTTYGHIAHLAGSPNCARAVGATLKNLPKDSTLPWHRVINAQGKISFAQGSSQYLRQRNKLESEGIEFSADRISLKKYRWVLD